MIEAVETSKSNTRISAKATPTYCYLVLKVTAMPTDHTLYQRFGGAPMVNEVVDSFYNRVLRDEQLRAFFENASVDRLKAMQKEFFAAALDGPMLSSDVDLARIHHGMGITREHLTRFVDHLIAVLDEHSQIEARDAMSIVYRIATYSDQIIEGAGATDG